MKIVKSIISTLLVMCLSLLVCATQLKTDVYAISKSEIRSNAKGLVQKIKEHGTYSSGEYICKASNGSIKLEIKYNTSSDSITFRADVKSMSNSGYYIESASTFFVYRVNTCTAEEIQYIHIKMVPGNSDSTHVLSKNFDINYYHGMNLSFKPLSEDDTLDSSSNSAISSVFNDRMSDWNTMLNNLGYSFEEIGFLNYYGNYTPEEPTTEEPTTEEPTTEEPTTEEPITEEPTTEEPTTEEPTTEEPTTEEPTTEEPTTEKPTTEEPTTEEPTTEEPTTDSDVNNGSGGNNGNNNNNDDDDSSAGNVGAGNSTNTPLLVLLLFASVVVSTGCILVRKK